MGRLSPAAARFAGIAVVALVIACGPTPPERNPPPALSAPAHVHLLAAPSSPDADVARLVVRRLNASRAPDERPLLLSVGMNPAGAHVVVSLGDDEPPASPFVVTPWRGALPGVPRIDPQLPPGADLALYDAVAVAGLLARCPGDAPLAWLRAQDPVRLALGSVSYADDLSPPGAPSVVGPRR